MQRIFFPNYPKTVKPPLSGHLGDLPKCSCCQGGCAVLFARLFGEPLTAKCIDLSKLINSVRFQGRKPMLRVLLTIQSGVRLLEVFNNKN